MLNSVCPTLGWIFLKFCVASQQPVFVIRLDIRPGNKKRSPSRGPFHHISLIGKLICSRMPGDKPEANSSKQLFR